MISSILAKTSMSPLADACDSNLSPAPKLIGFSITTVESAGTSTASSNFLRSISKSFKFSEKDFQRIFQSNLKNSESDPYKILGVNRSSTDNEIRKKWIKLNKEHHPDNLIAKGMPKEFIKQSNKELAAINIAYDKIKEIRGIS